MIRILLPILLAFLLASCSGSGSARMGEPFFPQLAPAAGERAFPSALAEGTLVLEGGCLRLREGGHLVVWPPQARLERSGDSIRVTDERSGKTVRLGERVRLAGGEVPASAPILAELRQPLPSECAGPYWLTSGIQ